jgi:hypothetical protein
MSLEEFFFITPILMNSFMDVGSILQFYTSLKKSEISKVFCWMYYYRR